MLVLPESSIRAKGGKDTEQQPKIERLFHIFLKKKSPSRGNYGSPPESLMKPATAKVPKKILHA